MSAMIIRNIHLWTKNCQQEYILTPATAHEYHINLAIERQTEIGWENMIRGITTPIWNTCHTLWLQ